MANQKTTKQLEKSNNASHGFSVCSKTASARDHRHVLWELDQQTGRFILHHWKRTSL